MCVRATGERKKNNITHQHNHSRPKTRESMRRACLSIQHRLSVLTLVGHVNGMNSVQRAESGQIGKIIMSTKNTT